MYQVEVTSAGNQYFFTLDSEKDVRTLVANSLMVTKVRIWVDNAELSDYAVSKMLFGEYAGV